MGKWQSPLYSCGESHSVYQIFEANPFYVSLLNDYLPAAWAVTLPGFQLELTLQRGVLYISTSVEMDHCTPQHCRRSTSKL